MRLKIFLYLLTAGILSGLPVNADEPVKYGFTYSSFDKQFLSKVHYKESQTTLAEKQQRGEGESDRRHEEATIRFDIENNITRSPHEGNNLHLKYSSRIINQQIAGKSIDKVGLQNYRYTLTPRGELDKTLQTSYLPYFIWWPPLPRRAISIGESWQDTVELSFQNIIFKVQAKVTLQKIAYIAGQRAAILKMELGALLKTTEATTNIESLQRMEQLRAQGLLAFKLNGVGEFYLNIDKGHPLLSTLDMTIEVNEREYQSKARTTTDKIYEIHRAEVFFAK